MPARIEFRIHAIRRMAQRGISTDEAALVVRDGETIEDYPHDTPFPSRLSLGFPGNRPLHVVWAYNASEDVAIVVSVYRPDPNRWDPDWKTRKGAP